MQINYRVNNDVTITCEADKEIDVIKALSRLNEVFGDKKCRKCGGTDIYFHVRMAKKGKQDVEYPELRCKKPNCRAKLTFGQNQTGGTVYPKRYKQENGENVKGPDGKNIILGDWGWTIFNKETQKEE